MLAVLEDGIRCFQEHLRNPRVRPRLLARQAEKWIRSDDWEWPFSFNSVCESLSLNPDSLRVGAAQPRSTDGPPRPRPSTHRVYRLTPRVKPSAPALSRRFSQLGSAQAEGPVGLAVPGRFGVGRELVDVVLQDLARLEGQDPATRDDDLLAGLRVPPLRGRFSCTTKFPKPGELDLLHRSRDAP